MSYILFNNKSSDEFTLKIENIPSFPSANAEYENINLDGRDGTLNIFKGYKDVQITFNFVFKAKENFESTKASIVAWLNSKINSELIYSKNQNTIYKVKRVEIGEFITTSKIIRRFTVNFIIHPICYINNKEILIITKPTTIFNYGFKESKPYIHVWGSGDITIYINNRTLVLKNVENEIEIDSEIMNCYKKIHDVAVNTNDKMYSPFPIISTGENTISWTGNVTKIEIEGRWCNLV